MSCGRPVLRPYARCSHGPLAGIGHTVAPAMRDRSRGTAARPDRAPVGRPWHDAPMLLQDAVDGLYRAFARYPRRDAIEICPHCVGREDQDTLARLPLRSLSCAQLSRFGFRAMTTWGTPTTTSISSRASSSWRARTKPRTGPDWTFRSSPASCSSQDVLRGQRRSSQRSATSSAHSGKPFSPMTSTTRTGRRTGCWTV